MAKNQLAALSKQTTKSFAALVKTFAKSITKGSHASAAFVVGYMDAAVGQAVSWKGIPESGLAEYAKGWQAATGKRLKRKKT